MKSKFLLLSLIISISAAAQSGKDISRWVGGSSIFESNKIYGKVKTIENITYVTDTNSYIFKRIYRKTNRDLHFVNYFLAFDSTTSIIEKKFDLDTIHYHKKFSYNGKISVEYDLLKNTEYKYIFTDEKRNVLLAREWTDSINILRRQNYSYSYVYDNKRLEGYTEIIYENDSVISKCIYSKKFQFDNTNKGVNKL